MPNLIPGVRYLYAVLADGSRIVSPEMSRLGEVKHINLTGEKPARIAGEINWDGAKWIVDNNSGRYSFVEGQLTPQNGVYVARNSIAELEALAKSFGKDFVAWFVQGVK